MRVKDIYPGSGVSLQPPWWLTNVNGTLFFRAYDGSSGSELWMSDGTEAGTVRVKDIYPGGGRSDPYELTDVNGTLFFRADDGSSGYELWMSDGTEVGTVRVKDINPGSDGSEPHSITDVNGTGFFSADDGSSGRELWALRIPCGDGVIDPDEKCDDGGALAGDGCDVACRLETCFVCAGEPSICSPDDGAFCEDDNECTTGNTCGGGMCGSPVECDDGDPCNGTETCNPTLGCVPDPLPSDIDEDGHPDACDNCGSVPNSSQGDADADGVGDACDACPDSVGSSISDYLGCGCADKSCDDGVACNGVETCDPMTARCVRAPYPPDCDRDGDGIPSSEDKCPKIFDPRQRDRDRDGVGDACDNCPQQSNAAQEDSDGDGIGDACQTMAPPIVTTLSPDTASPGTIVTIRGRNFGPSPGLGEVKVGDLCVDPVKWAARTIKIITPDLAEGTYTVRVTTAAGSTESLNLEVVASEEDKALARAKVTKLLRFVATSLASINLPQDYTTLTVLCLTVALDSYESLYTLAIDQYGLAATAGLLAKRAVERGKVQLAEKYLRHGREALTEAVKLESAAVDKLNGRLEGVTTLFRDVKLIADITVGCLAPFTPVPEIATAYRAAQLVVQFTADLVFSGPDEVVRTGLASGGITLIGYEVNKQTRARLEGASLKNMIDAALGRPDVETVFASAVAQCGVTISGALLKSYISALRDTGEGISLFRVR